MAKYSLKTVNPVGDPHAQEHGYALGEFVLPEGYALVKLVVRNAKLPAQGANLTTGASTTSIDALLVNLKGGNSPAVSGSGAAIRVATGVAGISGEMPGNFVGTQAYESDGATRVAIFHVLDDTPMLSPKQYRLEANVGVGLPESTRNRGVDEIETPNINKGGK